MAQCAATRRDRRQCTLQARAGSRFCFAHDPALADHRQQARSKGGTNKRASIRAAKLTPHTLRPVLDQLFTAMDGVASGSMEPKIGSALAALAGAVVRVYEVSQMEVALTETQARLAELEKGRSA